MAVSVAMVATNGLATAVALIEFCDWLRSSARAARRLQRPSSVASIQMIFAGDADLSFEVLCLLKCMLDLESGDRKSVV